MFHFLKNIKKSSKHAKISILTFLALVILIPVLVFAYGEINTPSGGYKRLKNGGNDLDVIFWNTTENPSSIILPGVGTCIYNSTNNDFFVPTRTKGEWDNFNAHLPYNSQTSRVQPHGCCGDKSCDTLVGENSSTCPADCVNTFVCGQQVVDYRPSYGQDDNFYPTVQIGNQCWMAKDMNVGVMGQVYGQAPDFYVQNSEDDEIIQKLCWDNRAENCEPYVNLYQWGEAMQYSDAQSPQGICLPGWHIPSHDEMMTLINYVGGMSVAGSKLMTHSPVWVSANSSGAGYYTTGNDFGFNGVATGGYGALGSIGDQFFNNGSMNFWVSRYLGSCVNCPEVGMPMAEYFQFAPGGGVYNGNSTDVYNNFGWDIDNGAAIRCLKN